MAGVGDIAKRLQHLASGATNGFGVLNHWVSFQAFESGKPRLAEVLEDFRREFNQNFRDSSYRLLVSLTTIEPRKTSHLIYPLYLVATLSPALQREQSFPQQPQQFFRGLPAF
jgi:hypothetical protein